MVPRAGVEPARLSARDFHTTIVFTTSLLFVVWTIPSPYLSILGARRLVSTPSLSLFANGAWLGISILKPSPNLTSSTPTVSSRALKFSISPLCLPISPPRQFMVPPPGLEPGTYRL